MICLLYKSTLLPVADLLSKYAAHLMYSAELVVLNDCSSVAYAFELVVFLIHVLVQQFDSE